MKISDNSLLDIIAMLELLINQKVVTPLNVEKNVMSSQAAMDFRKRLEIFAEQAKPCLFPGNIINKFIFVDNEEVPLRIYIPAHRQKMPIALFIHGGGFVAGSIATHENVCRTLAQGMCILFVSVEYPLAPETKHQKITEVCYQVLCWTANHAQYLGADPTNLMVMGDSAGGNLAAVCALMARDRQGPKIGCQVLINPIVDLVHPGIYEPYRNCYLNHKIEQTHPYVSPVYANLHDLPETFIVLNEGDCLYSQGKQYATLLCKAGVKVTEKSFPGGHLGYHFANVDGRAKEPIAWLLRMNPVSLLPN